MAELVVFSTADTVELAQTIAVALVETGAAACVNIIPGVRSVYRWEGKVCNEVEHMLLIKSSSERFEHVRATIRRLHTYTLPEVIAVPVAAGDSSYLSWLNSALDAQNS